MDDLISRQAAIGTTWEEPHYTDPLNVLTEVRDRIKVLPSAQPEIIACGDCKYWDDTPNNTYMPEYHSCRFPFRSGVSMRALDFCSHAERRDK